MIDLERIQPKKGKDLIFEKRGECIVCTSHIPNHDGYIRLYAGKNQKPRCQLAHRMVWKKNYGDIPEGYEVDHKCKNRACCNVEHLQILSRSEHKTQDNQMRYKQRIESVIQDIISGYTTQFISEKYKVPREYVYRYRRKLRNKNG